MVIRENGGQHKRGVEFATNGKNQHLLANRGSPPHPRATSARGQPVKPGGLHSVGLDTTEPLDRVDVGHDASADEVADRAFKFLDII
ncbi:hypothetical protein D3C80_932930 [compost metagenome]